MGFSYCISRISVQEVKKSDCLVSIPSSGPSLLQNDCTLDLYFALTIMFRRLIYVDNVLIILNGNDKGRGFLIHLCDLRSLLKTTLLTQISITLIHPGYSFLNEWYEIRRRKKKWPEICVSLPLPVEPLVIDRLDFHWFTDWPLPRRRGSGGGRSDLTHWVRLNYLCDSVMLLALSVTALPVTQPLHSLASVYPRVKSVYTHEATFGRGERELTVLSSAKSGTPSNQLD